MIILEPSPGIKKDTKLNFDVISNLLTTLLEYNHKRSIKLFVKVHKSRTKGVSYCSHVDKHEFIINLDMNNKNRKYIFGSILHEIRHCIQKQIFNYWPVTTNMKTWRDYWYSKEEVDARKIEALTTHFIKSYDAMVKMNSIFKTKKMHKIEK